jgi:hypothetical protein
MHPLTFSLVLCGLVVTGCSVVDEMTPRDYVGHVVAHAAPLKIAITKSLTANPGNPVPQAGGIQLTPPQGIAPLKVDFGWITHNGVIIIHSNKYAVTLVQEPMMTKDGIDWTCVVEPAEAKPALCGSSYQNAMLRNAR